MTQGFKQDKGSFGSRFDYQTLSATAPKTEIAPTKKFINEETSAVQQSLKGLGAIMADKIDLIYHGEPDDEEIPIVAIK